MRKLFPLILAASALFAQTSNYPGSLDTNSTLFVTADNVQTVLTNAMQVSDSVAVVQSSAGFAANMIVTICDATTKVSGNVTKCSAWEHMLVTSVVNSNTLAVTRGFAGTTARAHANGAIISVLIDSAHQTSLKSAVLAIETALGPNLSNVPQFPALVSSQYKFATQTPGGTLSAGACTIPMTGPPPGVVSGDTLYLSGGTGAAEVVTVSAVVGNNVAATCANSHSGAWTVQSATAGIQEAYNSLPAVWLHGTVAVPAGSFALFGPITISGSGVIIRGGGSQATTLNTSYTAGPIFSFASGSTGTHNQLIGLSITGPGSGSNYAVLVNNQNSFIAEDVNIALTGGGIQITGANTFRVMLDNVNVSFFTGNGISIEGGADHFLSRIAMNGNSVATATGINITQSGGTWMWDGDILACNIGMLLTPGSGASVAWLWITDTAFDSSITTGMFINPLAGGKVQGVNVVNSWTASATGSGGGGVNGTGAVLGSTGTIDGVRFIGHRFLNNNTNGLILFGGTHLLVDSSLFAGNGVSSGDGMFVGGGVSNWTVRNSQIGQSDGFPNTQSFGIAVSPGASDNFVIEGNSFLTNITGAISNGATGTHNIIRNNQGYNPVGQSTITVGASPFTYTAGVSPETVYVTGGTTTHITRGSTDVCTTTPCMVTLPPNGSVSVTYSVAPTMIKDVQ